jgi:Beta-propeller repeat
LAYSTYIGGGGISVSDPRGIAVDASGNAYVTGDTFSPNFPMVHPLPAPNNELQGGRDAFVAKLVSTCTTPPAITDVSVTPAVLWPPNHKMVNATVNYKVTAACGSTTTSSLNVNSNEPVNGTGDGNTSPDWVVLGPHNVELRAERAGAGTGRIYTITIWFWCKLEKLALWR